MKAVLIKMAYRAGEALPDTTSSGTSIEALEPITLMVLRMGFALPVYGLILLWLIQRKRKSALAPVTGENSSKPPTAFNTILCLKAMALGALCYYGCAFLDFTGLLYITAQLERMLLFTYPIFVMILGALFFGRKLSIWSISTIILAYLGITIIFLGGDIASGENVLLGSVLILGTALLFAIFQLLAVDLIKQMGSEMFTCIAMISATLVVFAHFLIANGGNIDPLYHLSYEVYILGLLLAFLATLLPSFLVNLALGRIGAQAVAILGMIGPIATIIAAIKILNEPFGWLDGVGTLLVIVGISLYTIFDKRSRKSPEPSPKKDYTIAK